MRTITGYKLVDGQTGETIRTYTVAQKRIARNRANKMSIQYGSYRYSAQPIITNN